MERPFKFLQLPQEIRDTVLDYAIGTRIEPCGLWRSRRSLRTFKALARVSRQLHSDVHSFISRVCFFFQDIDHFDLFMKHASAILNKVRNIHLDMSHVIDWTKIAVPMSYAGYLTVDSGISSYYRKIELLHSDVHGLRSCVIVVPHDADEPGRRTFWDWFNEWSESDRALLFPVSMVKGGYIQLVYDDDGHTCAARVEPIGSGEKSIAAAEERLLRLRAEAEEEKPLWLLG